MKNLIRNYGFWYGCLGMLGSFVYHIAAILGRASMPSNVWVIEGVFALHAAASIATFYRGPVSWPPMLSVTRKRITMAKILLAVSIVNFAVCLGIFLFAELRGNLAVANRVVPMILTSFLLTNTTYIAIHWAFRPENLFSISFLRTMSNPIGVVLPGGRKH